MNNVHAIWFRGNIEEYDTDLRRRKGAADTPYRIAHKTLVRAWEVSISVAPLQARRAGLVNRKAPPRLPGWVPLVG